jgi:hypothetical protein
MKNTHNQQIDTDYKNESHIARKKRAEVFNNRPRNVRDIVDMIDNADEDEPDPREYARFIR